MTDMPELLPCPFCGGEGFKASQRVICCDGCGACPIDPKNDTLENNIKMWNRRSDLSSAREGDAEAVKNRLVKITGHTREHIDMIADELAALRPAPIEGELQTDKITAEALKYALQVIGGTNRTETAFRIIKQRQDKLLKEISEVEGSCKTCGGYGFVTGFQNDPVDCPDCNRAAEGAKG